MKLRAWVVVDRDGLPIFVSFDRARARSLAEQSWMMAWKQIVKTQKYRIVKAFVEMSDSFFA